MIPSISAPKRGGGPDAFSGDLGVSAGSTGTVTAILAGSFGDEFLELSVAGAGLGGITLNGEIRGGLKFDTAVATPNVTQTSIEA